MRSVFLLLLMTSCTNYVEINNSLNTMEELVKNAEYNNTRISSQVIEEIGALKYVIEANREASLELITDNTDIPTTEQEKVSLINDIRTVYEKESEQKERLGAKINETKEVLDKAKKNYNDYYRVNVALKEYLDILERGRPSRIVDEILE